MIKLAALIRMARPLLVTGAVMVYALGLAMGFAARGYIDWPAALANKKGLALEGARDRVSLGGSSRGRGGYFRLRCQT